MLSRFARGGSGDAKSRKACQSERERPCISPHWAEELTELNACRKESNVLRYVKVEKS